MTTKTRRPASTLTEPTPWSLGGVTLRSIVNDVLGASPATDPRSLAAEVAARIPAGLRQEALAEALVPFVREAIRAARSLPADQTSSENHGVPVGGAPNSAKVAAMRAHGLWLRGRYHVGKGAWKILADCDFDDLMFMVSERRAKAAANEAEAEKLLQLADRLRASGVSVVGELMGAAA